MQTLVTDAYSVEIDRVSLEKRGQLVLSELSIDVTTGLTALLGRNGAGKTTLMRILAGVQRPTSGLITTSNGRLYRSKKDSVRHLSTLGWVPQGPGYPGTMRAENFVDYAAWLKKVGTTQRQAAVSQALERCNADSLKKRPIKSLSGGERQRVILASAIVGNPRFLLLDEPTAGLDPAQRESYLALLRELSETTTVLYSTHLVDDVVRTATRVLVLDNGRISDDISGQALTVSSSELGDRLRLAVIESSDRNTS